MIYIVSEECFADVQAGKQSVPHGKTYSILNKDHRDNMPWLDQTNLKFGKVYTIMPNEKNSKKRIKVKCVSECPMSIIALEHLPKYHNI